MIVMNQILLEKDTTFGILFKAIRKRGKAPALPPIGSAGLQ
jgi:hypothetical protein